MLIFETESDCPAFVYHLTFQRIDQPPDWVGNHAYKGEWILENRPPISNPPADYQRYVIGDFERLMDDQFLRNYINVEGEKKACRVGIVCHPGGWGDEVDLELMMLEIKNFGFLPEVIFRF